MYKKHGEKGTLSYFTRCHHQSATLTLILHMQQTVSKNVMPNQHACGTGDRQPPMLPMQVRAVKVLQETSQLCRDYYLEDIPLGSQKKLCQITHGKYHNQLRLTTLTDQKSVLLEKNCTAEGWRAGRCEEEAVSILGRTWPRGGTLHLVSRRNPCCVPFFCRGCHSWLDCHSNWYEGQLKLIDKEKRASWQTCRVILRKPTKRPETL